MGQGIGSALYTALEEELQAHEAYLRFLACIAVPNEAKAFSMHEKRGYVQVAHFPKIGYKFNNGMISSGCKKRRSEGR